MLSIQNWLTNTNTGRTVSHAGLAFLSTLVPLLLFTSTDALQSSFLAALPAAAAAAFRILFANPPEAQRSASPTAPDAPTGNSTVLITSTPPVSSTPNVTANIPTVPQDDAPPAP